MSAVPTVITLAQVLAAYEDSTGKHLLAPRRLGHRPLPALPHRRGLHPSPVERLASGHQPPAGDAE